MNLLYLSGSQIPSRTANSVHVMKMCQALARAGHRVTLTAFEGRCAGQEVDHDPYAFYGVERCFELRAYPHLPEFVRSLMLGIWAGALARWTGADLVYGRFLHGCVGSALFGLPVIFEAHSPIDEKSVLKGLLFRALISSSKLRSVVVISEALKDYWVANYPALAERIIVAPDAAEPPRGGEHFTLRDSDRRLQVGYVGHLYQGKCMEIIVRLAVRCPWATFHIAGGTEHDIARWKQATRADNVEFYGHLPHVQTDAFRQACDVLVAPFLEYVQGYRGRDNLAPWMSPLKVFEYMAAAKPIVCSNLPVLREVLSDGENALLCAPGDLDAWVEALERLDGDVSLRASLGERAHRDFIAHYTWQDRVGAVLAGLS